MDHDSEEKRHHTPPTGRIRGAILLYSYPTSTPYPTLTSPFNHPDLALTHPISPFPRFRILQKTDKAKEEHQAVVYDEGVLDGDVDGKHKKKLRELNEAKAYAEALPESVST